MVDIRDAADRLSELVDRVRQGEEVVLTDEGVAVARLVPVSPEKRVRRPGTAKGALVVPDDFDDPLPDDELESWY